MSLSPLARRAFAPLCCAALYFLYLFGLDRAGLLGPDEPRYAAIGREMARSGDWITPRLWGQPWFEKPALSYWMTAAGFKAGLNAELAPRLPVALASAAFLLFFFAVLRREFGFRAAFYSATILATSAGWLAFSHVAVTDLPMSAAFAASMLLAMAGRRMGTALCAGALLGMAVLAKGLVPLALCVPALWLLRRRPRDLACWLGAACLTAAPWYALVAARHGYAFLDEFFWKHHFERYTSAALQHLQPAWFYVPVMLAAMFPWTPLLALPFSRKLYADPRSRFLAAWFTWGFVFFSLSRNKLPGYLLPVLPPAAALAGMGLAAGRARHRAIALWLGLAAMLVWLIPAVQQILPQALLAGISRAGPEAPLPMLIPVLIPAIVTGITCAALEMADRRSLAVALIGVAVTLGVVRVVIQTYPELDATVSPRALWRSKRGLLTCVPAGNRGWRYGLSYYAERNLPECP